MQSMRNLTRLAWIAGVIVVATVALYALQPRSEAPGAPIATHTQAASMRFEVVTTLADQERGLGGRSVIPDDYGMLFPFTSDQTPGFWMKDMLAPIDIVWIDATGTILKVDASVATSTYPEAFYPPAPVRYVLETQAGYAAAHAWSVGTKVALPAPYGAGQ